MALVPVIEGAGGLMTDWRGRALTAASDGRVLAAGDRRVHGAALALLAGAGA
jgi:inositol-phosphate phosphatase/L-galactose 1-phosphate phosphatase/histidinol-phosphatase